MKQSSFDLCTRSAARCLLQGVEARLRKKSRGKTPQGNKRRKEMARFALIS
jgi:hypothetical protein